MRPQCRPFVSFAGASEVQPARIITNSCDRVTAYDLSAECNATGSSHAVQQPVQQACRLCSSAASTNRLSYTPSAPLHTTKALLPCLNSTSSALSHQNLSITAMPGSLCSPTQANRPTLISSAAANGKHQHYASGVTSCFCMLAQRHDCMLGTHPELLDHPFLHNSLEHKISTA